MENNSKVTTPTNSGKGDVPFKNVLYKNKKDNFPGRVNFAGGKCTLDNIPRCAFIPGGSGYLKVDSMLEATLLTYNELRSLDMLVFKNLFNFEKYCMENTAPICNYFNHLTTFGFKYFELTQISEGLSMTTYAVILNGELLVSEYSGRTRHISQCVAKMMFSEKVSSFLHTSEMLEIEAQAGADSAVTPQPRELPEDTLRQTTDSAIISNTEITQGADVSSPVVVTHADSLQQQATTEPIYNYPLLTERFVRVATFTLNVGDVPNQVKYSVSVPDGLYDALDSTTASVLRPFTSISCDVEFTFKVNANQAQCGRYVVSHLARRQGTDSFPDNVYRQKTREHAEIDVAASNDVVYLIPYENTRPFIPIQTNEVGALQGGTFAHLEVRCLSPVVIAEIGSNVAHVQVYMRLRNVRLTAMRFPVQPQSLGDITDPQIPGTSKEEVPVLDDGVVEIQNTDVPTVETGKQQQSTLSKIGNALSAVKSILTVGEFVARFAGIFTSPITSVASILHPLLTTSIEKTMNYFGGYNKDHPAIVVPPIPVLPQAQHSLANSIGGVPLRKLRMEQTSNTPQFNDLHTHNTPRSIVQIAQIPSFYTSFNVTTSQLSGDLLVELPVIPLDPRYPFGPVVPAPVTSADQRVYYQMPTVSFFTMMYTNYTGALIYEFDCVKTPAHNFSMQVAYVPFNGQPGNTTMEQMQSCKWVTMDFRNNNRAEFVSPFISFNLMRQYPNNTVGRGELPQNVVYSVEGPNATAGINYSNNVNIANQIPMRDPGKIVVRLVNTLNPTPIVSTSISVLVYVKASPGFKYLVPRPFKGKISSMPLVPVNLREDGIAPNGYIAETINNVIPAQSLGSVQAGEEMTLDEKSAKKVVGTFVQSMEVHDDILGLCRRTYFHTSLRSTVFQTVVGTTPFIYSDVPYYATFPITPYTWPTRFADTSEPNPMNVTRGPLNPRDVLCTCFRWFRGGMNFTIVLKPTNGYDKKQIMVTHTPPVQYPAFDSARQSYPTVLPATARLPSSVNTPACGFASDLLVPSVNPVMTVEVPFYTPVQYVDLQNPMNNNRSAQQIPFNELTAWTLGQLQFHSLVNTPVGATSAQLADEMFEVNIYSTFADDALFQHFIGVPPATPNYVQRTQVMQGGLGINSRVLTRDEIVTSLVAAGVESNPGPAYSKVFFTDPSTSKDFKEDSEGSTSRTGTNWFQSFKNLFSLPNNIAKLSNASDIFTMKLEEFKMALCAYLPDVSMLQVVTTISAVAVAYTQPSKLSILTAALSFLALMPIFLKDVVTKYITNIYQYFKPPTDVEANAYGMNLNGYHGVIAVFTSLFCEGLLVQDKVSKMPNSEDTVRNILLKYLGNFNFARTGAICILMYRLCLAIETLWCKLRSWCESYKVISLLEVNQTFIDDFMENYTYLMNEINVETFNFTRVNRDRYWTTVIQAYYLQSVMVKSKTQNPTLRACCMAVINKANQVSTRVTAPPVRYEPYVLWMHGPRGVGKSTILQKFLVDMAENIHLSYPADPIYVVNPTSSYMNGLYKQPIVMFDDMGAVADNTVEPFILSNFMAMKSCARLMVEKPRLEEKETEFTASIVGVASNFKFWPVTNSIREPEALDRRRDMLVSVDFSLEAKEWFAANPTVKTVADSLPKEMVNNNRHLSFIVEPNVFRDTAASKRAKVDMPNLPVKNHDEFQEYLLAKHSEYHNIEIQNMLRRYKNSLRLSKSLAEDMTDETSLKLALISVSIGADSARSDIPYETLRQYLFELEKQTPEYYKTLRPEVQRSLTTMSQDVEANGQTSFVPLHSDSPNCLPLNSTPFVKKIFSDYVSRKPNSTTHEICSKVYHWVAGTEIPWDDVRNPLEIEVPTPCMGCGETVDQLDNSNYMNLFCCNSQDVKSIHWLCNNCSNHVYKTTFPKCPTCDTNSMIHLKQFSNVSLWKKTWYWLKAGGNFLYRAFGRVIKLAVWASILLYVSTMLVMGAFIIEDIASSIESREDVITYVNHYGQVPHDYLGRDNHGSPIYIDATGKREVLAQGGGNVLDDEDSVSVTSSEFLYIEEHPIPPRKQVESCVHPFLDLSKVDSVVVFEGEDTPDLTVVSYVWDMPSNNEPKVLVPVSWKYEICECDGKCYLEQNLEKLQELIIKNNAQTWRNEPDSIPSVYRVRTGRTVVPKPKTTLWIEEQKNLTQRIREKTVPKLAKVYFFIKDHLYYIIAVMALLFGFMAGYRVYWCKDDGMVPDIEGNSGVARSGRGTVPPTTRVIQRNRNQEIQGNSDVGVQGVDSTVNRIKRNLIRIQHTSATTYALGVYGSTALIPRHAYYAIVTLEGENQVLISSGSFSKPVTLSKLPLRDMPELELVSVELPSCFSFKNIIRQFNPSVTDEYIVPISVWVYSVQENKVVQTECKGICQNGNIVGKYRNGNSNYSYNNVVPQMVIVEGFEGKGECISPIMDKNGCIIALHVGGLSWCKSGYATPIFRDNFDVESQSLGSMQFVRTVEDAPFHTHQSKIFPSPLAKVMHASTTEPCIQSRNDVRVPLDTDPLIEGCKSIGAPTLPPDLEVLQGVYDAVYNNILRDLPAPYRTVPVDDSQAVSPSSDSVSPMDLSTSSGYPLSRQFQKKNMIVAIDQHGNVQWINHIIRKEFQDSLEKRMNGEEVETIYWAHLKDELRAPEKNRSVGGTRVFHVAPFELILNARRLLLPFLDAFFHRPLEGCHGVGLVPESLMWVEMVKKLKRKGDKIIQLDFSKFSDTLPHEFVKVAFNCIKRWYAQWGLLTPEVNRGIVSLERDILYSKTLVYNDIYQITNGVLQGHPLTAVINSLVNIIEQVYIFAIITSELAETFFEKCAIMVMGDDVVISVSDDLVGVYNARTIAKKFALMGIKVTDPFNKKKSFEDMPEFYDISELTFLSRSVMRHPFRSEVLLAPIKMQSLLNVPLWLKKSDGQTTHELVQQSISASCVLAFTHGPVFYNIWCDYIVRAALMCKLKIANIPSWQSLDVRFYGGIPLDREGPGTCACVYKCMENLTSCLRESEASNDKPREMLARIMLTSCEMMYDYGYMETSDSLLLRNTLSRVIKESEFGLSELDTTPFSEEVGVYFNPF